MLQTDPLTKLVVEELSLLKTDDDIASIIHFEIWLLNECVFYVQIQAAKAGFY